MPPAPQPYISRRPQITIGGVTLNCHSREARLTPSDDEVDTAVYCAPSRRTPGNTAWTLELVVLQSFGAGGLYQQLAPMAKTSQTYLFETNELVGPTEDHPHFTGTLSVPSIPVLDAAIGDKSEFTLTFWVNEEPTMIPSIGGEGEGEGEGEG